MKLAFEITKFFHGEDKAKEAQDRFIKVFREKEVPEDIPAYEFGEEEIPIVDLLLSVGAASSRSEAKRLINQGGVYVNGERVKDFREILKLDKEIVLKVGKRRFYRILSKVK